MRTQANKYKQEITTRKLSIYFLILHWKTHLINIFELMDVLILISNKRVNDFIVQPGIAPFD